MACSTAGSCTLHASACTAQNIGLSLLPLSLSYQLGFHAPPNCSQGVALVLNPQAALGGGISLPVSIPPLCTYYTVRTVRGTLSDRQFQVCDCTTVIRWHGFGFLYLRTPTETSTYYCFHVETSTLNCIWPLLSSLVAVPPRPSTADGIV